MDNISQFFLIIIIKKKELKNHKINHAFNNLKQKCLKSI